LDNLNLAPSFLEDYIKLVAYFSICLDNLNLPPLLFAKITTMAGQLIDRTLGGSLQNIAKLESSIGWTKFNREIRDYLTMNGFGDLLGRNKDAPAQGTLTPEAYATKQESWLDKQERAIAIVHSRCGYNARDEIKGKTVLNDVLLALQKRYRPTGSAIFQQLDHRYYDLTLADCKNVSDFAEKLREARNELLELDATCLIGEPHFVNKFLTGLGSSFDIFLTSFYQNHALILVRDKNKAVTTAAVTFEEAFIAAEKEEQNQSV
jgi:gag-polypeptide of LTR copia-type